MVYRNVKLSKIRVAAPPTILPTVNAGKLDSVRERSLKLHELEANAVHAISWTRGRLWFDRVTLTEAVAEFNFTTGGNS